VTKVLALILSKIEKGVSKNLYSSLYQKCGTYGTPHERELCNF